jgi:hypothetical protein
VGNLQKIIEKALHENAATAVRENVFRFSDALVLESKAVAALEGADEVQTVHVEKAKDIVFTATRRSSHFRDVLLFVGSLLLGLSLQGFLQEYGSTQPRVGWMAFYFGAGLAGTILSVAAFLRR